MQASEEFSGHALPIHDHSCDLTVLRVLFIARQECGDAHCEMLVPSMSGDEEGMAVLVVEQQQRSAAQDDAQTPDQSARDEHLTVDWFAMSIHIAVQRVYMMIGFSPSFSWSI